MGRRADDGDGAGIEKRFEISHDPIIAQKPKKGSKYIPRRNSSLPQTFNVKVNYSPLKIVIIDEYGKT